MLDGIWFINSAIKVNQLSVYSTEERVEQTLDTLQSIDKYCPSNHKYIFDGSIENPYDVVGPIQHYPNTTFLWTGDHPNVNHFGRLGLRSLAETLSFYIFLTKVGFSFQPCKRFYKISGRYQLNDNFVLDDPSYKDSFVFADKEATWMDDTRKKQTGADYLYKLRLWHMDSSLLDTFYTRLPYILEEIRTNGIDVEHAYWKHLHKYDHIELTKIGVQGNIGPNGEFIDD